MNNIDTYESFSMPYRTYRQIYLFMFSIGVVLYVMEEILLGGMGGFYMEDIYYAPILGSGVWIFLRYIFYTSEERIIIRKKKGLLKISTMVLYI